MSTSLEWVQIALSVGSIAAATSLAYGIKSLLHRYRSPNGKRGAIISLHTVVAFATITVVALTTKDWFLTGLTIILAYLVGRGKLDSGQHYLYQVIVAAIIGVAIPYSIFYLYYNKLASGGGYDREEYDDKPKNAVDERFEADEAPELRLEDIDIE